ncbi:UNVERIFIED_ORG: DNA polymerase III delta prime subunit [Pseudomonas mohnii]|jgi:DNA polymerase III delta prime subunit|nr:DNA polymerase III delta prime subunit [Pseudomonas mohnii]
MAEHAAEFKLGEVFLKTGQLGDDIAHCAFVVFFDSHVQQVAAIGQTRVQFVEGIDDLRQRSALAAQFLGVFRFVPDTRIFKLAIDLGQALMLLIVVKDTPE